MMTGAEALTEEGAGHTHSTETHKGEGNTGETGGTITQTGVGPEYRSVPSKSEHFLSEETKLLNSFRLGETSDRKRDNIRAVKTILLFKNMSDKIENNPHVIPCDMCTEEDRKPALKTCMKCEISMCVQHLQAHLTTPVLLQTHTLTEPMAPGLGGATKCPQHGKLLEYYCLDDMTCVCVSCAIEDQHRLHNMKTFSTAHRELVEKLSAEQHDQGQGLENWEKGEREKLARSSVQLVNAVTNLRDIALTSVQSSVSARMVAIRTSRSSKQAAQKEKDTFRFLQMYSQVQQDVQKAKAVDLRKGLEPGSERDKLLKEIKQDGEKMVKQAVQFMGSLLALVDPENHQALTATSSDLTFDPENLGSGMSLSRDQRKVFYSSWLGNCSATFLICSPQGRPDPQRWTVSLSQDSDWTVGLRSKTDRRLWGLCCKGNQLSSLEGVPSQNSIAAFIILSGSTMMNQPTMNQPTMKPITREGKDGAKTVPRPQLVEVFWDSVAYSLSFFSRSGQYQREEIITIKNIPTMGMQPFVQLENYNPQNNPHLKVCTCRAQNVQGLMFGAPSQCRCGTAGRTNTTEVVCELQ